MSNQGRKYLEHYRRVCSHRLESIYAPLIYPLEQNFDLNILVILNVFQAQIVPRIFAISVRPASRSGGLLQA